MRYTLNVPKTRYTGSTYAKCMILMGLLAIGLIVFDFIQSWRFMVYVFFGVK